MSNHPSGTARVKGMTLRKPSLLAIAVVSIVFGPGEKVIAAQNTSKAISSRKLIISYMTHLRISQAMHQVERSGDELFGN